MSTYKLLLTKGLGLLLWMSPPVHFSGGVRLDHAPWFVTIWMVWDLIGMELTLVWLAFGLLVALALYGIATFARRTARGYLGQWRLVNIKGEFTADHHLPDQIPVPKEDVSRVAQDEFTFDEAVEWIKAFVEEKRMHRLRPEYQAVLRKYELYREMAKKMGRGLWRDVDQLGQRLSEIDPLDPSALVARGRAMRELGNYAGAIRQYQKALDLTPFHSTAFPEFAATCRAIGQPGRFRAALEKARDELGDTHPLTLEGRIQLGELVRVYADPMDAATVAHIPRDQYVQNVQGRLDEMTLDAAGCLQMGQSMLADDMPELAESLARRCDADYGECAETLLLNGMIEHYRFDHAAAETLVRDAIERDDSALARLELGRILLEQSQIEPDAERHDSIHQEAQQQLRLAIDRDPNLFDAISLLVEPAWEGGMTAVLAAVEPLINTYPDAWGPWRVLGDAYATAGRYRTAIESYRSGLQIEDNDQLLLPCMEAMEEGDLKRELTKFAQRIRNINARDPQLRWKVAHSLFDAEKFREARRVLQDIVDDERVPPPLRQRSNEVLDHLDDAERKRSRKYRRRKA